MKILMYMNCLAPAGGVEQYLVSIMPKLREMGVDVALAVEQPPPNDNQYLMALRKHELPVYYPRLGNFNIYSWSWVSDLLLLLLFPFTLALLAALSALRSQPFATSYASIRGRVNSLVSPHLPSWTYHVPAWLMLAVTRQRLRPDLIHVLRAESWLGLQWAQYEGVPQVYTEALEPDAWIHYGPEYREYYERLREYIGGISVVITQSERVAAALERRYGIASSIVVMPWVVQDPGKVPNPRTLTDVAQCLILGTACRLSREKDVTTSLDAFRLLHDRYPGRLRFVIAGDGPDALNLKRYVDELGIAENVFFTGAYTYDTFAEVFGRFDVYVTSSLTEGAPLAVIEALAYGKPVIATDVAGTGELLEEGETGFLIEPKDPTSLARFCEQFIEAPELVHKMGYLAYQSYQRRFAPEVGASSLYAVYENVMTGNTHLQLSRPIEQ